MFSFFRYAERTRFSSMSREAYCKFMACFISDEYVFWNLMMCLWMVPRDPTTGKSTNHE